MKTKKKLPPIHPGEILLHDFMEPLGLTQTALAKALGVTPIRINHIVRGQRSITADTALRLSRYFGTRPGWYFEPGRHGGTINDIAIHAFDFIPWMTGLGWRRIVGARTWNAKPREFPHFNDCAQFLAELENGAGVSADLSYLAPDKLGYQLPYYWRVTVHGTRGMAETHLMAKEVTVITDTDTAPQQRPAAPAQTRPYLSDFLNEIRHQPDLAELRTADCLRASRLALEAEAAAR